MTEIIQQLISGVAVGCIYALFSLGLVLIYKSTSVVNFSQGEIMMIGAFVSFTFIEILNLNYFVSLAGTVLLMALIGWMINAMLLRPLVGQSVLATIMLTLGLSMLLRAFASSVWGPETFTLTTPSAGQALRFAGVVIGYDQLIIIGVTSVLVLTLFLFFKFTRLGIAMQATSENTLAAYYMGIPVRSIHATVWALSAATAGVAGLLLAPITFVHANMGVIGMKAFPAAVLGGFGSVPGAIIGGIIIGVVESLSVVFLPEGFNNVAAYVILLVVLAIRPQGIFASASGRRV